MNSYSQQFVRRCGGGGGNGATYAASNINLPPVSVQEDSNTESDKEEKEESKTICSSIVETTISAAIKEAALAKVSNKDKPDFLITLNGHGSMWELVESIEEIDFSKIPKLGGISSNVTPIYLKSVDHTLTYYHQLTMVETKKNGAISKYTGSFIDGLSKLFAENETIQSSEKIQEFLGKFRKIE